MIATDRLGTMPAAIQKSPVVPTVAPFARYKASLRAQPSYAERRQPLLLMTHSVDSATNLVDSVHLISAKRIVAIHGIPSRSRLGCRH